MDNTRVITYIREDILADVLYSDGRMTEMSLMSREKDSLLGNIYIGKVKNIVRNIQAAFVEIADGVICYLPLEDVKKPVYSRPKKQEQLVEGDELLVQVNREAVKTKAPSVTTNISLTGKYLVLSTGNPIIGYSSKLKPAEKERLKTIISRWTLSEVGLIVRTNASEALEEELNIEYQRLLGQYQFLTGPALHRTVFSCVWKNRPAYLTSILGTRSETLREIVTDNEEVYHQIQAFLQEEMPQDLSKLRLYTDRMLPLKAMYRMDKGLTDALSERVWLKSGAYLVIEQTEALTVIDVNTGKYIGGKNKAETTRKINQEAAVEIARQLRLRNLSGIILVDFVDMEGKDDPAGLLVLMNEQLKQDPMKAAAVDMTALGLMEITRKKQKKTLQEQAKECGI